MNPRVKKAVLIATSAMLFTFLFYRVSLGLNLILFESVMILFSFLLYKPDRTLGINQWLFQVLLFISMLSVVFSHTAFSIVVNIFIFLQTMAMRLWPEAARIQFLSFITPLNVLPALAEGFRAALKIRKPGVFRKWPGVWLTLASLLIIWLFVSLYAVSNRHFSDLVWKFSHVFVDAFNYLFNFEHADVMLYFILGTMAAAALLIKTNAAETYSLTTNPGTYLIRQRKTGLFKNTYTAFVRWFRTGMMLMAVLNVIILIFNYLDVVHVWFCFEWNGQLLREFIHEGTWTLVFCIALSALLAVLFFNGNIHFYSRNKTLKWLVNIWVAQNLFMTVSVLIRNIRYVDYYNLASLRIGVFIFLLIAIFAMTLLLYKINKGHSMFWLLKSVFVFSAVVLVFTSVINWNRVIARYNISHRESGYFHYDYMVMLPGQTLDIIAANRETFDKHYRDQEYHLYTSGIQSSDTVVTYNDIVKNRIEQFNEQMNEADWREWNFADWRTFKRLKENK